MIGLLALVTMAPRVIELPDLTEDRIVFQAIAPLPEMGARDIGLALVLAEILPKGTEDYSEATLTRFTSQAGSKLRCVVMPDHIQLRLVMPKGQLANGVSLFDSLLRRALLPQDAIDPAIKELPYRARSYWAEALDPWIPDYTRMRYEDVTTLYQRAFSPNRVVISVGGAFEPGQAKAALDSRFQGWLEPRLRAHRPGSPAKPRSTRSRTATTIELSGIAFSAKAPDLPARLLAAVAMGTGKGSSLHRLWRDLMGVSYRQEAVLWPDFRGFRIRLIAAMLPIDEPDKLIDGLRKAIADDIEKWNFETLEVAIGMAEGVLLNGVQLSPLYLSGPSPLGEGLEDKTFAAAYWMMKTGELFEAAKLQASMRKVSLEELQKAAREWLETVVPMVIAGSR